MSTRDPVWITPLVKPLLRAKSRISLNEYLRDFCSYSNYVKPIDVGIHKDEEVRERELCVKS